MSGGLWWDLYRAAVLESDPERAEEAIQAAARAMAEHATFDRQWSSSARAVFDRSRAALTILQQEWRQYREHLGKFEKSPGLLSPVDIERSSTEVSPGGATQNRPDAL